MSFVSSKSNILCRLINIELYKIFAIMNRAIKGLHCIKHVITSISQHGNIYLYLPTICEPTNLRWIDKLLKTYQHSHVTVDIGI